MAKQKELDLITSGVARFLSADADRVEALGRFRSGIPNAQQENLESVLRSAHRSYRDVALIQLAYGICSAGRLDLTRRPEGARGLAGKVGEFLASHHIAGVRDAYQNVGKNSPDLVRGNFAAFDEFLRWASDRNTSKPQLKLAFEFACASIATTARPVRSCPEFDAAKLSFGAMAALFDDLFKTGSQGAYQQFSVAALLHAIVVQLGTTEYRVETKNLNSSDKSSRTAGDVQILHGTQLIEAFEVTANDWTEKIAGATRTIREHDLSRLHIIAHVPPAEHGEMIENLKALADDISVLELGGFVASLTASLRRGGRKAALIRLYEFLDRYQPDVDKVNRYVNAVEARGLTLDASEG